VITNSSSLKQSGSLLKGRALFLFDLGASILTDPKPLPCP
jgi:hypothetical protein